MANTYRPDTQVWWANAAFFIAVHLLALVATLLISPWRTTPTATLVMAAAWYQIGMVGCDIYSLGLVHADIETQSMVPGLLWATIVCGRIEHLLHGSPCGLHWLSWVPLGFRAQSEYVFLLVSPL
jgi:hypothetical protein